MSNWISSKLKVAETFLQQIDQQAAESLKKNDSPPSPSSSAETRPKKFDSPAAAVPPAPLKYQLPPKKSPPPPDLTPRTSISHRQISPPSTSPAAAAAADPAAVDWTELLSSPTPPSPAPSRSSSRRNPPKVVAIPLAAAPVPPQEKRETAAVPAPDPDDDDVVVVGKADGSSGSSSGSEESSSGSDSEEERLRREERRERRERAAAEKAAAAAVRAIKEREDAVARLEGEKQSLEKILEERAKQQALEASELQMNMIETMEAVELEKQKHNSTRMEALACLAKLETTNAELAKSLATSQWNLELEVNRVSELRQKIELKELAQEAHRRRIQKIHQKSSPPSKEQLLRKTELEQEILDAEYSFICSKISQLKDKAKKLEENIENTKRERVHPTDVEIELRKRLSQLTDHLIQKQTQVEALSSEKATMVLRIEMVSRLLDETGVSPQTTDVSNSAGKALDIEAGAWQNSSKSAAGLHERIRSGRQHLGSLLHQLDAIFSAGYIFLRRNPTAQLWSLLYILCLHIWVIYILMSSHSQVTTGDGSHNGAVYSLETINNTSGL
ncbi:golgin candidate 2 [Iris pallida]|uniref:Golgin candidate 2 n=1 Tax=Iris pallida TaxID=29817 RepID=A0AAX6GFN4_IRIPA|nr:golgin candidate 2 [Iris pallida]